MLALLNNNRTAPLKTAPLKTAPLKIHGNTAMNHDYAKLGSEQKIKELQQKIARYALACKSNTARPIDRTNLLNARLELMDLK